MKTVSVKGSKVQYDEKNAREGIKHLTYDLDYKEAKVFFDQARIKGEADFEDDLEKQYTLAHNQDGTYTLKRRR